MNRRDSDVLLQIYANGYSGQRELASCCGCSLGAVNASVNTLLSEGYLNGNMALTERSRAVLDESAPRRAVLLAAAGGLRIPPHRQEVPKALLQVDGETLIERMIRFLNEVGIREICVVAGFQKERFEYLIDTCNVDLICNPEYSGKNNLHSLALAERYLNNCYVVPCDIWCAENPFRQRELYSWYMVSEELDPDSSVRVNRKQELALVPGADPGNAMIGISYLLKQDGDFVRDAMRSMDADRRYKGSFWEETLYGREKFRIGPRTIAQDKAVEINVLEDLLELNYRVSGLHSSRVRSIAARFGIEPQEMKNPQIIKKGTTNRSVVFEYGSDRYVLKIPENPESRLFSPHREEQVYRTVEKLHLSDEVVCFDRETGTRIAKYMDNTGCCRLEDPAQVASCMGLLRRLHEAMLEVDHEIDLYAALEYYESLWQGSPSVYRDYPETKAAVLSLKPYIDRQEKQRCLIHMDPAPENFLICRQDGAIRLIDWEYAGMGDPHLDIAMFCLQGMLDRTQVDDAIDAYFQGAVSEQIRLKIYCYIAAGGLLWSNWCEYRQKNGTEFGVYSLRQYRFAKEYYKIIQTEWNR